ncbi:AzlD domain-containing protein [Alicyclobacillus tolerans]|uniref:AzlD domain-containing protein n=1 Tax=Alicyclobacillus tolerans TaxID=90970 RepID=UPI001F21215A|nr:AzlD domain-containing protein [Alicyclobacillus tolerans]MCF8564092.1 AzlD domain-containing protein [Alicyclobacillus tolerans]
MNGVALVTLFVGAGTYLIRAGSLSLGSRVQWPDWVRRWLSFVTPAVLGALLGPTLLLHNNQMVPLAHNAMFVAAVPTALVAWWSRHLLWTVAAGVACYALAVHWL